MNLIWILGRFTLLLLAIVAVTATAGCEQPMMLLRFILACEGGAASSLSQVSGVATKVGFNAEAAVHDSTSSDSESLPKAEDLINDWEKPAFALFVSGDQYGYMEPCGCTGLANQKGGLMRRHSAMKVLKERGWNLVPIDSGNQVRRFGQQPILKLGKTYQALSSVMDYEVIGIGPDDLKLPSIDLCQAMLDCPTGHTRFTSANVEVVAPDVSQKFEIIETGGKKIGVTMVLGDEYLGPFKEVDDLTILSAAEGLSQVVPKIQAAQCDLKVLVAHASLEECRKLAKQFPVFDILIASGGAGDPTLHPEIIEAGGLVTSLIQVGIKGMYVGVIGYYVAEDGSSSWKYERVPLDERFEDSPEIKEIFLSYQMELKRLWERGELADIKPRPHPSGYKFVGSAACADCHNDEYQIWEDGVDGKGGPHEKATRDLTAPGERAWVQRHFDPECVSCHMTGWNPQLYYPYVSGYMDLEKDKHLHANGCENCHGPGSAHIAAEEDGGDEDLMDKLREEMRVTLQEARESACVQCHDLDNSPDYVKEGGFDEYWPHIKH